MENILQSPLSKNFFNTSNEDSNIYVLYTTNDSPIAENTFKMYLNYLPDHLKEEVLKYRKWNDKQNCLIGKILLSLGYNQIEDRELDFNFLKRDKFGKPYLIDSNFEFNISHTKNTVVCAFSKDKIGIDIETVREIDLQYFETVFSIQEMKTIKAEDINKFYEIWTKKEALAKAVGKGFGIDFLTIKVDDESVFYEDEQWQTNHFILNDNFCSLVFKNPKNRIRIKCLSI